MKNSPEFYIKSIVRVIGKHNKAFSQTIKLQGLFRMRIFVIAFAVIAATSAASISSDYLPPVGDNSLAPSQEYLAPVGNKTETSVSDDGHRRNVSDIVNKEYLPPNEGSPAALEEVLEVVVVEAPLEAPQEEASEAVAVEAPEEKTVLADDGYHYKTVRRIRYRHRRDVNELPANEYLPPNQEPSAAPEEAVSVEVSIDPPQEEASKPVVVEIPEEKTVLADDGYHYKTVRRIRYRHRRDVNELPANEYLPPNQEPSNASEEAVSVEVSIDPPQEEASKTVVVEIPEEKTLLADDGYHYKTVRRIRYRHRRDVNELPANEYLPPNQEPSAASEEAVFVEVSIDPPQEEASKTVVVEVPEEKTVLADDGYHYKTVRRIRYRHRRDVNELPANEYLPPNQEPSAAPEEAVSVEVSIDPPQEEASKPVVVEIPEEKTVLADDGYHYKTVRRIRYRHRRDVNELPANEYLPPNQEPSNASEEAVSVEVSIDPPQEEASKTVVVEVPEEKTVLADDGYHYNTVRRIRYRHRRDVNQLPANEYLPPHLESSAASEEDVAVEAPIEAPQEEASETVAVEGPEEKTLLADDGYHYKTIRHIRYRHRRDVNQLPANEYLPPHLESSADSEEAVSVEAPIEVPHEDSSEVVAVEAPEEKTILAEDGYHYKTVRRIRYRHRRDVNELPTKEYLPPNQESSEEASEAIAVETPIEAPQEEVSEAVAVEAPEEKTILADDGYHYKTVRRIRYRHRRDVNELPANEYLPPNQELSATSEETVAGEAPIEAPLEEILETVVVEAPEENTVLADDGYRYQTVRRIRYRHRRDVNELPANEYLPPNQELSAVSKEAVAVEAHTAAPEEGVSEAVAIEAPEEKTILADDGYRYNTVRRIRYRRH